MASPFPGVDPYLESQGRWPDFHGSFLTYTRDVLNDRLPESYVAQLDERIRLVEPPDDDQGALFRPDLAIFREGSAPGRHHGPAGAATLTPVTIPEADWEEVREVQVKILHLPEQRLVTVLELLSTANKTERGMAEFQAKRLGFLGEWVHQVDLDLLIAGHRIPLRHALPPGDCFAFVSRADRRQDCEVYAWSIRRPLPKVPVPLLAPDPDVWLDLAELFATAYERGRYARLIDYQAPLPLPLAPEDRAWAEELARASAR